MRHSGMHGAHAGSTTAELDRGETWIMQFLRRVDGSGELSDVDEAKDQIKLEVDSGIDGAFKVQDGLIFNAIHRGDYVEITVETIGGTKTIVGLKKL